MPADIKSIAVVSAASSGGSSAPLLIDIAELSRLTSLSLRHLRRLDASGDIPGRVTCGRRVLFKTEVIRRWVEEGLPGRDRWRVLQPNPGR